MRELADLLRRSKKTVAFTGAGVSTLSGIQDFRGKNGVYSRPWKGRSVEEILSLDCFVSRPELFYEWAKSFVYCLDTYQPSAMHLALAHLEKLGKLDELYTQNIDLLHQKAGSKEVYEIHGSPALHHCLKCGASTTYTEIAPLVMDGRVPHCEACGGLIKPDIVFYGEALNDTLLRRGLKSFAEADLALVMGSSLTVYPAAALPDAAAEYGVDIVVVNEQPTHLDRRAVLKMTSLAEAAKELAEFQP